MLVGALQCGIEAARLHVLLDLTIPLLGHELLEPLGKTGQLRRRKAGNHRFKFFDAHGGSIRGMLEGEKRRLAATALAKVGDLPKPAELDDSELAAWTALGNVLLNLNETITN